MSYKDFHTQFRMELGDDTWKAHLLSGASPIAAKEIRQRDRVPEYFFENIGDWIIGEIVGTGQLRQFLLTLMRTLFVQGGSCSAQPSAWTASESPNAPQCAALEVRHHLRASPSASGG